MIKRLRTYCLVPLILVLLIPGISTAQAADPTIDVAPLLGTAMMGLGPLPGASMLGPVETKDFEQIITDHAWPMPVSRDWPIDIGGRPIVETRQKDEKWHTMESWETLGRLRTIYKRSTAQLQELNPDLDLYDLQKGQKVRVWKRDDDQIAESRGEPQSGRLIYGEPIPDSEHYEVAYPHRSFGTYYAVSEVVRVLDEYYEAFPDADPLIIGDFSFRTGRSIHPHNSHQGGRDADITLPRQAPPPNYNRFHHIRRDNLDAERTLWILTTLLEGGYVENIFLDWHHQRTLYRLAKEQGAPDEWLKEVFQYPSRRRRGIIRHEPGHATHMHIRFSCQETDRWCR